MNVGGRLFLQGLLVLTILEPSNCYELGYDRSKL